MEQIISNNKLQLAGHNEQNGNIVVQPYPHRKNSSKDKVSSLVEQLRQTTKQRRNKGNRGQREKQDSQNSSLESIEVKSIVISTAKKETELDLAQHDSDEQPQQSVQTVELVTDQPPTANQAQKTVVIPSQNLDKLRQHLEQQVRGTSNPDYCSQQFSGEAQNYGAKTMQSQEYNSSIEMISGHPNIANPIERPVTADSPNLKQAPRRQIQAFNQMGLTTAQVGQPYRDLSFQNVFFQHEQQLMQKQGRGAIARPASQHTIQRAFSNQSRQVQSQLAFLKPVRYQKQTSEDSTNALLTDFNSETQLNQPRNNMLDNQTQNSSSETTEYLNTMYLAKSNRPRYFDQTLHRAQQRQGQKSNFINLNYIQRHLKLSKNWQRPSTSSGTAQGSKRGFVKNQQANAQQSNFANTMLIHSTNFTRQQLQHPQPLSQTTDFIVKNKQILQQTQMQVYNKLLQSATESNTTMTPSMVALTRRKISPIEKDNQVKTPETKDEDDEPLYEIDEKKKKSKRNKSGGEEYRKLEKDLSPGRKFSKKGRRTGARPSVDKTREERSGSNKTRSAASPKTHEWPQGDRQIYTAEIKDSLKNPFGSDGRRQSPIDSMNQREVKGIKVGGGSAEKKRRGKKAPSDVTKISTNDKDSRQNQITSDGDRFITWKAVSDQPLSNLDSARMLTQMDRKQSANMIYQRRRGMGNHQDNFEENQNILLERARGMMANSQHRFQTARNQRPNVLSRNSKHPESSEIVTSNHNKVQQSAARYMKPIGNFKDCQGSKQYYTEQKFQPELMLSRNSQSKVSTSGSLLPVQIQSESMKKPAASGTTGLTQSTNSFKIRKELPQKQKFVDCIDHLNLRQKMDSFTAKKLRKNENSKMTTVAEDREDMRNPQGKKTSILALTAEKEPSAAPLLTEMNDSITGVTVKAAFEKHGVTQYYMGGRDNSSCNSVFQYIEGVETDQIRQQLIDTANKNCHNQVKVMRRKQREAELDSIEVGSIDAVIPQSNRDRSQESFKNRKRGSKFTIESSIERMATSRGATCGQCSECIRKHEEKMRSGISTQKIRLEKQVGNSNQQALEVLRPKWVNKVDMERLPEDITMNFKLRGPELFEKQLPMLITASNLQNKRDLRAQMHPLDTDQVFEQFMQDFMSNVDIERWQHFFDNKVEIERQEMSDDMKVKMMFFKAKISKQTTKLLSCIPIQLLQLDEQESQQIDSINTVIFDANPEDYDEAFCLPEKILDPEDKPESDPCNKVDSKWLLDPEFDNETVLTDSCLDKMDKALPTLYNYMPLIGKYLNTRVLLRRDVDDLFEQSEEMHEMTEKAFKLGILQGFSGLLQFPDLDKITEPRSKETRIQVHIAAKEKLAGIVEQAKEYGFLTEYLEDAAFNTDYGAIEDLNAVYDEIDNFYEETTDQLKSRDQLQTLKTTFSDFFSQNVTNTEEICAKIEEDTVGLIEPVVSELQQSLFEVCSDRMRPESTQFEKYRSYAEHIFVDYPPLKIDRDDNENRKFIENFYQTEEKTHNRMKQEAEIYRGWAFPINTETVTFQFLEGANVEMLMGKIYNLRQITEELTTVALESLEKEVIRVTTLDDLKHKSLVHAFNSRLHHADPELSSDLLGVSFYKEEFALPPSSDPLEEDERFSRISTRFEIIKVYPLTARQKWNWFENSPFYKSLISDIYQSRRKMIQQNEDATFGEVMPLGTITDRNANVDEEEVKRESDQYRNTVRQMYKRNLVIRVGRPEKRRVRRAASMMSQESSDSCDQGHRQAIEIGDEQHTLEQKKGIGRGLTAIVELEGEEELQSQQAQSLQALSVREAADSDSQDMQFRITMRTQRTAQKTINSERFESPSKRSSAAPPILQETLGQIEESKENDNASAAEKSQSKDQQSESSDDEDDAEVVKESKAEEVSSQSSDDSFWKKPRTLTTNMRQGVHKALRVVVQEPDGQDAKQPASDKGSEKGDEADIDKILELLAQDEPPATTVREVNKNLLEHPDFEQLNIWMDQGARDLSYEWNDQDRKAQEARFVLDLQEELKTDQGQLVKSSVFGDMLKHVQAQDDV